MNHLVVALGNPGITYRSTRHNAGWIILDQAYPDSVWKKDSYAEADVALIDNLILAKPFTFMNLSGESVRYLVEKKEIIPENIIVVYDDIDLALGKFKISFDRGSGGHNGIKSIEMSLGGRGFIRIRIGISKILESGELVKPNVLGKFEPQELETLTKVSKKVKLAIDTILNEGKEKAMTEFNSDNPHVTLEKN